MGNLKKIVKESTTVKIFIITILIALFLIPLQMVKNLIMERQSNEYLVKKEIGQKWGQSQLISGPFLVVPYTRRIVKIRDGEEEVNYDENLLNILPNNLKISGELNPVIRKRGIYEAILYDSNLKISGIFKIPDIEKMGIDPELIKWDKAVLNMGISDLGGIKETISLKWNNGTNINFEPGLRGEIANSGVSTLVPIEIENSSEEYNFDFDLNIQGSESINFIPLGKTTEVTLNSTWASPSFQGRFVPDTRDISQEGFTATWKVLDMNRNFPQQFTGYNNNITQSKFGVNLIKPVSEYQKNMRTVKYSLLIIILTFLIFFFFEILGKFKIHPIQYSFIGLSLSLFFILLLSLSEQIGFDIAYLISFTAITIMILIYSASLLKSRKKLILLTVFLIAIYGFIYVILQLEDFALLVGSLGLFVALFTTMYYSRKIDWYNINFNES